MNATGAGVSSPRLDSEGGAVQCLQCGHRGAEGYAFGGVPEAGTLCDSPAVEVAEKDVRDFGSVEIGFRAEEVIQDFELRRAQAWFVGLGDLLAWVGWEGAEFAIGLVDDASTIGRERMDLGLTEGLPEDRNRSISLAWEYYGRCLGNLAGINISFSHISRAEDADEVCVCGVGLDWTGALARDDEPVILPSGSLGERWHGSGDDNNCERDEEAATHRRGRWLESYSKNYAVAGQPLSDESPKFSESAGGEWNNPDHG